MASKSRAAQEKLAELEKNSAHFYDQLHQAAKFVGLDFDDVGRSFTKIWNSGEGPGAAVYHGRQEWLLRWLLKKMQEETDPTPRITPDSWILFSYLIRVVPPPNTARMLHERKFMTILRQALDEAKNSTNEGGVANSTSLDRHLQLSKKRKWSGELILTSYETRNHVQKLPAAILTAVQQVLQITKPLPGVSEAGRTATLSAEYIKSAIRTPAENAAKILGAWISVCHMSLVERKTFETDNLMLWLSPFVEVWDRRLKGTEDLMYFSLHCSQPLLCVLKALKTGDDASDYWVDEMEQLIARNVLIPAKVAKLNNADSDLLSTLTRISITQDSANASTLFDVAIRSIQSQGLRRRRPSDESWLQTVFTALKDAMSLHRAEKNGKAIQAMLQSAIKYKVVLGLSTLGSIASEYCFLQDSTNWELLATVIKLDFNVFLILRADDDLVQQIFTRVTNASLKSTWSTISLQVTSEVVVPLMHGFAKARDLSAFIYHWHDQVLGFNRLRKNEDLSSVALFSAWEDELLQTEFSKIMEASLTVLQITHVLDWLSSQTTANIDATCVILEAMATSIQQEEVVDAVGLRLFHILFDNGTSQKLDWRYKWRSWRTLSRMLNWANRSSLEEFFSLWGKEAAPIGNLSDQSRNGSFLDNVHDEPANLEKLEILRYICAAWNACQKGTKMEILTRKWVLDSLNLLSHDIKRLPQALMSDEGLFRKKCGPTLDTLDQGFCWILWSTVFCVLVDYSRVLELGPEMKENSFREFLQTIFWIASVPQDMITAGPNSWHRHNAGAFPSVWAALLNNDEVLSRPILISLIIDIMLCNANHDVNPLVKSPTTNNFAVECLLQLPIEVFSRKDRERIMNNWLPSTENAGHEIFAQQAALGDPVLSLKVKIMQRCTIHEGASYQNLVSLADALALAKTEGLDISLPLFRELVRRTISHVTTNLDQPRNREYASDVLGHLRKSLKTKDNEAAPKLNLTSIVLIGTVLETLTSRESQLIDLDIIPLSDVLSLKEGFQRCLLSHLDDLLSEVKDISKSGEQTQSSLILRSVIGAFGNSVVSTESLASIVAASKTFAALLSDTNTELGRQLNTWISNAIPSADMAPVEQHLEGGILTVYCRQALAERTREAIKLKDQRQKLALLQSILGRKSSWVQLDKLWAARQVIISCQNSRQITDKEEEVTLDLSSIFSLLSSHLWESTTLRQLSVICETMVLMLRTKSRAMNQWNIDSTLGNITVMCSRNAPNLRPTRAGNVYIHLCQLLQTLIISHRLKLEGRFHLLVQAMQSLLRCLFTPLPHSTAKSSRTFARPPWLSSPKHQLNGKHAAAFARLITLICDPSVSSVTRSKNNNLSSVTEKSKRMAGQHMQWVLTLYVQLQLEMKMLPEVRKNMAPGLYAIFDTTTPEMRSMIGDGLDSSGRAVFGMLLKDYQKFGKWKGS